MFAAYRFLTTIVQTGDVPNPTDGVTPSLDVFGTVFKLKVNAIVGGIWMLCIVAAFVSVVVAGGKWGWNTKMAHSPEGVTESAAQFKIALVAFACLAGVSLIIGAILWVVQKG